MWYIDWWSQIWRNFSHFGLTGCRTLVGLSNLGGQIQKNICLNSFLRAQHESEIRNSIAHRVLIKKMLQTFIKKQLFWLKIVKFRLKSDQKHEKNLKKCTFFGMRVLHTPKHLVSSSLMCFFAHIHSTYNVSTDLRRLKF